MECRVTKTPAPPLLTALRVLVFFGLLEKVDFFGEVDFRRQACSPLWRGALAPGGRRALGVSSRKRGPARCLCAAAGHVGCRVAVAAQPLALGHRGEGGARALEVASRVAPIAQHLLSYRLEVNM